MPPKAKGKGKAPKGHVLCAELPEGTILKDLRKNTWKVGNSIGSGGFGLIYLANEETKAANESSPYVIKIEPESNGPLFCELAFYNRAARAEQIEEWAKKHKRSFVGVPKYIAQGRHEQSGENLRFMVMPRCGTDLHKLWLKAGKSFKRATVAKIAIQMIDALEYIHSKEYIHADIKGSNILCDSKDPNKLLLVDYGLANKYATDRGHKDFKPDPKKAHNGTIEYTSCDAHLGASPSRRGDFEILGFVLLHWICGHLPWEDNLKDCNKVRDQKIQSMKNVQSFVKKLCPTETPDEIVQFLTYAGDMKYEEEPDYEMTRNIFKKALKSFGVQLQSPLDFSSETSQTTMKPPPKKARKVKAAKPLRSKTNTLDISESDETMDSSDTGARRLGKRRSTERSNKNAANSSSGSEWESRPACKKAKSRTLKKAIYVPSDVSDVDTKEESSSDDESFVPTKKQRKPATKKATQKVPCVSAHQQKNTKEKPQMKSTSAVRLRSSTSSPSSGLDDATVESTSSSKSNTNTDVTSPIQPTKDLKKKARSSRYSMAPLHTKPVLTENDQLTGTYSGKHPVIKRKRKVNVPKANAETQTTPSLKRTQSRK
uniref:non-specific serine/threonine protein kinase n=1 Tax=Phallusia mammillata TaxID=59560 RepID=A0A6F9DW55_9ASCI|nr:serine/threonine-protein kinase VRK1 [Phallusia mammillata]